jgi:hypothetical protein
VERVQWVIMINDKPLPAQCQKAGAALLLIKYKYLSHTINIPHQHTNCFDSHQFSRTHSVSVSRLSVNNDNGNSGRAATMPITKNAFHIVIIEDIGHIGHTRTRLIIYYRPHTLRKSTFHLNDGLRMSRPNGGHSGLGRVGR